MKFIAGMFTEHLGSKAMAALLAVLIWAFLYYSESLSETLEVPLELQPPATVDAEDWRVTLQRPSGGSVRVTLRGPKSVVGADLRGGLRHRLVLSEDMFTGVGTDGPRTLALEPRQFTAPTGAEVVRIEPDELRIQVDRLETAKFTVRPSFRIADGRRPPPAPEVSPRQVLVRGPARAIRALDESERRYDLDVDLTTATSVDRQFTLPVSQHPELQPLDEPLVRVRAESPPALVQAVLTGFDFGPYHGDMEGPWPLAGWSVRPAHADDLRLTVRADLETLAALSGREDLDGLREDLAADRPLTAEGVMTYFRVEDLEEKAGPDGVEFAERQKVVLHVVRETLRGAELVLPVGDVLHVNLSVTRR